MTHISLKNISTLILLQGFFIAIGFPIISPLSIQFTWVAVSLLITTIILGVFAYLQKSLMLRLFYQLGFLCPLFVISLRTWDSLVGLSWMSGLFIIGGLILAGMFPSIYKKSSMPLIQSKLGDMRIFWIVMVVSGVISYLFSSKATSQTQIMYFFAGANIYFALLGYVFFLSTDYLYRSSDLDPFTKSKSEKRHAKY